MKQNIKVIFGKEQVMKINKGSQLTKEELKINVKVYTFETIKEKKAFIKGIDETVGWTDYYIDEQ